MANIKISELTALTSPDAADLVPVTDSSASQTKRTTVGEIVGIINGDVDVTNDGIATISELPVSKLQDGDARQLLQTDAAGTGVEWTSNVDVAGTLDVTSATTLDAALNVAGLASLDGGIDVDGAFTVANTSGNIATSGTLGVDGQSTLASVAVSDLTSGRVVLAGTSGELEDNTGLTFNGTQLDVDGNVVITGDLTVEGASTILETETVKVEDKNIELGVVTTPTDVTADGGGITLKGNTDKTINWIDATDAWTFSEHINIASGKEYRINGTKVLDATSLGSAVVSSSLTSVGTITSGTWQGTAIDAAYLDGTVVTTGDTGTVTSTMIADGTIVDADVSATAEIAVSKLANGTANQVLVTNGTDVSWSDDLTIAGNLTVNGTTTTVNTETLVIEDKNIELGVVGTPTNITADGGGITLKGTTDKTINWINATDSWTSSEHVDLASGKSYRINGTEVLSGTTLGSGVTGSSLTSVGTLGSLTVTGSATAGSFIPTSSSAPTNGLYLPATNSVALSSNGTGQLFIDSSGNIKLTSSEYQTLAHKLYGYGGGYGAIVVGNPSSNLGSVALAVDVSGISGGTFAGQNQVIFPANGGIVPNNAGTDFIGVFSRDSSDSLIIGPDNIGGKSSGPMTLTSTSVLVGTASDSGGALLQVNGDRVRIATAKTPASASDTGTTGEVCWDANYIYVCTATDTWKRAALSTW